MNIPLLDWLLSKYTPQLVVGGFAFLVLFWVYLFAYERPTSVQRGYDGVAMQIAYTEDDLDYNLESSIVPSVPLPLTPDDGPRSGEVYKNVQVLGGISAVRFVRLMTAMTAWVVPQEYKDANGGNGCGWCHNVNAMQSDEGYPNAYRKHVARRMIQMTQNINENWAKHVKGYKGNGAGVNCYTCHRGIGVPKYYWYRNTPHKQAGRMVGDPAMQNAPSGKVVLSSLPGNPFEAFLEGNANIRVAGPTALPTGNRQSIKQAEWTYGLMMHFSDSLGVNCTYCHNSRVWRSWEQSPPQRSVAWYGIRMLRDVNNEYMVTLKDRYPAYRIGPTGDAPKANCKTCHQGVYKPLLGQNMVEKWPSLTAATPYTPPPAPPPTKTATAADDGAPGEVPPPVDGESGSTEPT